MPAFIYLWKRSEYDWHRSTGTRVLGHAASNRFRDRGVRVGDRLYVVACFGDAVRLLGRLDVAELMTAAEAEARYGDPSVDYDWATDHAFAADGQEGSIHFDLILPPDVVGSLQFADGSSPARRPEGGVEPQTFRLVRRLSARSAAELDCLLQKRDSEAGRLA